MSEAELQSWLDREVDPEERARISRHLEACVSCRQLAGSLRASAETFSAAMLGYDELLAADSESPAVLPLLAVRRDRRFALPRRASRAAAVVLLLGAAAAAAMVPGSPIRALFSGSAPEAPVVEPAPTPTPVPAELEPGASITVSPHDGELTVRIDAFAEGTLVSVRLVDGAEAIASLPDGSENARFIVASGVLEVRGSGPQADHSEVGGVVELRLPRSLRVGVVELDGTEVVRVTAGRLITQRQVSREGDEAVFQIGG